MAKPYIKHLSHFDPYAPPGHTGTVNLRIVEKDYTGTFEMVLGTLDPGCGAHRHAHDIETQICYVVEGEMEIVLDDDPPVRCGPGTVVGIPPHVQHTITNCGNSPLKLMVIYSPPLPPRNDVAVIS